MVTWVSRAQSGLAVPDYSRLSPRTDLAVGVTKHHTGGAAPRSPGESWQLWRGLQAEAMSGQNVNHTAYGDIEYNAGFDDFAQILVGRPNTVIGAHAASSSNVANRFTYGIAYLGSGNPSPEAMEALNVYVYVCGLQMQHAPIMFAHSDWARLGGIVTDCPGALLRTSKP